MESSDASAKLNSDMDVAVHSKFMIKDTVPLPLPSPLGAAGDLGSRQRPVPTTQKDDRDSYTNCSAIVAPQRDPTAAVTCLLS